MSEITDPRWAAMDEDPMFPESTREPELEDEAEHERIAPSQNGNSVMDDFRGSEDDPLEKEPLNEEKPQREQPYA